MAVNVKQLFVTQRARIDVSVSSQGIYLTIYKPVSHKQVEDNRKVPIFRQVENNNQIIENKVTIKLSTLEVSFIKWILEEYPRIISFDKFAKRFKYLAKQIVKPESIQERENEHGKSISISIYRPNRPYNLILTQNGLTITVIDKTKNPPETYSIAIPLVAFSYLKSVFEFIITDYLQKYKYEFVSDENKNGNLRMGNNKSKQPNKNVEQIENVIDDISDSSEMEDDDFDF